MHGLLHKIALESFLHWLFFTNRICLHVRNFEIAAVSIFGNL
jgi:hypothetical protein